MSSHALPMTSEPVGWRRPAVDDGLLADCYAELRTIARRVLRDDGGALRLQPTDLAHEAAIRMMAIDRIVFADRAHFLALSAKVMRRALLDEVRRHRAHKRQAPVRTDWQVGAATWTVPIEGFDAALERLTGIDPDRARVVELRFYAGLTMTEIATATATSLSTVERQWRSARAWLMAEVGDAAA